MDGGWTRPGAVAVAGPPARAGRGAAGDRPRARARASCCSGTWSSSRARTSTSTPSGSAAACPGRCPVDAVMALLTAVVPGELVQKAVLLGAVYAAVLGAARLVPPGPDGRRGLAARRGRAGLRLEPLPRRAAADRPLDAAAGLRRAALDRPGRPAAARRRAARAAPAGARLRTGRPRRRPVPCSPPASCWCSSAGARALVAGGAVLVLSLPWIVAGVLHPAGGASDPAGVAAFAARAEGWGGPLLALLGTGGIWNAGGGAVEPRVGAAPAGDAAACWPSPSSAGPAAAALRGSGPPAGAARRVRARARRGRDRARAARAPGGGGPRRARRRAAAGRSEVGRLVGAAAGAGRRARRPPARGRGVRSAGRPARGGRARRRAAAVLLPLIAVPDLVWGVGGRLQPVEYPADWQRVRDTLAEDAGPGDVLVLPFGAYRAFDWNDDRPQLDPGRPLAAPAHRRRRRAGRRRTGGRRRGPPRTGRRRGGGRPRAPWPTWASAGCSSSAAPPAVPMPAEVHGAAPRRRRRGPRPLPRSGRPTCAFAVARSGDSGGAGSRVGARHDRGGGVVDHEIALYGDAPSSLPEETGSRMKTLVAVLIALGGGTPLGVAAVARRPGLPRPRQRHRDQRNQTTINVLDYGTGADSAGCAPPAPRRPAPRRSPGRSPAS